MADYEPEVVEDAQFLEDTIEELHNRLQMAVYLDHVLTQIKQDIEANSESELEMLDSEQGIKTEDAGSLIITQEESGVSVGFEASHEDLTRYHIEFARVKRDLSDVDLVNAFLECDTEFERNKVAKTFEPFADR